MSGFLGTYHVNLDGKGRITIPSKFRAIIDQEYDANMILCVMEDFLIAFPQKEWGFNEEKMSNLSAFDISDRNRLREFYSRASECKMKESGKILIPQNQREIAGLEKEVALVGMSKTFEIWSKDRWDTRNNP